MVFKFVTEIDANVSQEYYVVASYCGYPNEDALRQMWEELPEAKEGKRNLILTDSKLFKNNNIDERLTKQIENNFQYHAPKRTQQERYHRLRERAKELAHEINKLCPNSREKSLALTHLEDAIYSANASIARNE